MTQLTMVEKIAKVAQVVDPFISSISLEIRTDAEAKASAEVLLKLKKLVKGIDEFISADTLESRTIIAREQDKVKQIKSEYCVYRDKVVDCNGALESALKSYQKTKELKAFQLLAEQREAERKRIEAQTALKEQAEKANEQLLEQSKQVGFQEQVTIDEQIKTNLAIVEQAQTLIDSHIPAIIEAPKTKITTDNGTVYKKTKYIITNLDTIDITKLPYEYLMIDTKKLQKAVNAGVKINGVEVEEDFDIVTRKK